ncbi:DUF4157 domain-containing protein [Marimonas sp. MJW-29]|uniref:DUF4157 domain-containing protein n=1 Tax=Sulfitobacter sediminis TaxID=3234186 RepID=A0ABV3RMJ3_9RHOB
MAGGAPLPSALRQRYEGAFGENFADVRLHTGAPADRGARAIDATAFTSGTDIAFAGGAFRPETSLGRGVLAHELAHVSEMRAGRDSPHTLRRIGEYAPGGVTPIFSAEWWNRLGGGGTFSNVELDRFVRAMARPGYQASEHDYDDTDNMARVIVNRMYGQETGSGEAAYVPPSARDLRVRRNMIQHLLSGHRAQADRDAAMLILRRATDIERQQIVQTYGQDDLMDHLGGTYATELANMLGIGVEESPQRRAARRNMPVRWLMNTTVRNAPGLSSAVRGLVVEKFMIRPTSHTSHRTIASNARIPGDNVRNHVLTEGASHPRNEEGSAGMTFWVEPQDATARGAYAYSTRTPMADQNYPTIPAAEEQAVEATLEVDLGAATIGEVVRGRTASESHEERRDRSTTERRSDTDERTDRRRQERRRDVSERDTERLELSLGASAESIRGFEEEQNWQRSVSQTRERLEEIARSWGRSTTSTRQTEIDISSTISGDVATTLRGQLGLSGEGTVGLQDIGTGMLGTVLRRLPTPQARTLGAILSMIGSASAGLTVGISGQVGGEQTLRIGGSLTGRAARLWSEARTRSFNLSRRTTDRASRTDEASEGGRSSRSGSERRGVTAGTTTGRERSRERREGATDSAEQERRRSTTRERSRTESEGETDRRTDTESIEVRRNMLVPVVRRSQLSFRIVRNAWAHMDPRTASEQLTATEQARRARVREEQR